MTRVYPSRIADKFVLCSLLNLYLDTIAQPPLSVTLRALSYDSDIPESIFKRLMNLNENLEDAPNIEAEDYHILFSNVMFRFPTVKIWMTPSGGYFFEM